jgi:hypothetical protein
VRLGNFIEVSNDLFMHIIATADIRYKTTHNADFENRNRDQSLSRSPTSTAQHEQEGDLTYAELRFGADFRYQKSLTFQLLFENQSIFDGNLIDDRSNTNNPGGVDVFGRNASGENPGFRVERYWARYKFPGTPVLLHVGADLQSWSEAGLVGNDNPRIGVEVEMGDFEAWATAVVERESQRLGLQNDNDNIYYVFGASYNMKPHRFEVGVTYFRDRFAGADTQTVGFRNGLGWTGQKTDSVWLNASWSTRMGPIRAMLQGNLMLGTARGANARGAGAAALPATIPVGRDYDILAGAVIAYVEADLGIVRPFVGFVFGSADGDPTDDELHGFQAQPVNDSTQITGTPFFSHLDTSVAFALRDYSCPARMRGVRDGTPQGLGGNPYAIGARVLGNVGGDTECSHSTSNVFNSRIGESSHPGIVITYSNPGTMVIPVGLKVFPVKGHQLTGYYVYRAMVDTSLVEAAFVRGVDPGFTGSIGKTQYHGIGGWWMWTLNPHFDIRLDGEIAIPGDGYKDIAELATCGARRCDGDDPAMRAGARFRARF